MRVYVAGPMRGYDKYNFPEFDAAALDLRKMGYTVINPAELDRVEGIHEYTNPLPADFLRQAMSRDCQAICTCTHIFLLRGWEHSSGVAVELALARLLGLKVIEQKPE